jgi:hypothetical protein
MNERLEKERDIKAEDALDDEIWCYGTRPYAGKIIEWGTVEEYIRKECEEANKKFGFESGPYFVFRALVKIGK